MIPTNDILLGLKVWYIVPKYSLPVKIGLAESTERGGHVAVTQKLENISSN